MKKLLTLVTIITTLTVSAQDSTKWDLRRLVDYAMKNNISVKQAEVQARISALQAKQAQLNQYPSVSGSSGLGLRLGRSIDPTTNNYSTTQFLYQNFGVNSGVEVYNWGRLKNSLAASKFSAQAALADVERAANDVALNVCTYYLQVLASKEQMKINEVQIAQTQAQYQDTKKRVDAGSLPELNLVELESQLAGDSTNWISSKTAYEQNILSLKGLLNIDPATKFEVETPPVEKIPLESLIDLQPDLVYAIAATNQPLQKGNELRTKAAQRNVLVAKSAMYPSVSFGVNLATNFSNSFKKLAGYQLNGVDTTSAFVNVGSTPYKVLSPNFSAITDSRNFGQLWEGYGKQLSNNFGQSFGFSLSIPIFNNGQYRIGYAQSKLSLRNNEIQQEQANQTLKLNIYTAYTNAINALQKFNSGKKQVDAAQKVYDFSKKRYDVGLLSTLDLITNQNKLQSAKIQQLSNQYDYVFRMKLLEFYRGQGLKL